MSPKKAPSSTSKKNKNPNRSASWFKNFKQVFLNITIKIVICFFVGSVLSTIIFRFIPIPFTPLMLIRSIQQKIDHKPLKLKKQWVPLEESGPMPIAAIAGEDAKFMDHIGFDFEAIDKAVEYNKTHQKKKGASTISQQTAKNVFLWPGRSWARKGLEVYFTLLIELFWSKERIIEVYVNVAEMGDGVYGAEAASKYYFKKSAKKMTRLEAAKIAAILPNPRKWSVNNPSQYLVKRQNWIRKNMDFIKDIDF